LTTQVLPEIRHVPDWDSVDAQWFFVRRREPQTEFSHVLSERLPAVVGQIVSIQKLGEQGSFIPGDRDNVKNIIARIIAVFWTGIRHHVDTSPA